jgi:hypothetical protein
MKTAILKSFQDLSFHVIRPEEDSAVRGFAGKRLAVAEKTVADISQNMILISEGDPLTRSTSFFPAKLRSTSVTKAAKNFCSMLRVRENISVR